MEPGDDEDDAPEVPRETVSKVENAQEGKDVLRGSAPPADTRDDGASRGDDD